MPDTYEVDKSRRESFEDEVDSGTWRELLAKSALATERCEAREEAEGNEKYCQNNLKQRQDSPF